MKPGPCLRDTLPMSCARVRGPFLTPLGLDAPLSSMVALVYHRWRSLVDACYRHSAPRCTHLTRCATRRAWFAASLSVPNFVRNVAPTVILFDASCDYAAAPTTTFCAIVRSA